MPGWSRMPSTTSRPPLTRLTTPSGSPSESSTSKAICCVSGTCSDGFSTNVLPQAIANGRNQNGTIAGKLKGTIAAQTPTGWRIVSASIPRETSSRMRPCIVVGIAQAHSTISIMRATSARASPIVLPISVVTERASSSCRLLRPSRSANRIRASRDHRHVAPRRQRRACGGHGGVEVGGRRQRHARERLAGGGVRHVERVACRSRRSTCRRRSYRAGESELRLPSRIHSWSGSFAIAQARAGPAITFK